MLGRLARWLRAIGLDTLYDPAIHDHALVRLANVEGRVLLTRDRHLLRELRPERALRISSDRPLEQLRQVVEAYAIAPPEELFTRCMVCNTPLVEAPRAAGQALLPPKARGLPGPVRTCPGCGRVYWRGSHTSRMEAAIGGTLTPWSVPD